MPYPNEYAARIHEPGKYKEFRREKNKFGSGIDVIWGVTSEGKTEVQTIRFNKEKFSSEEVHSWLTKHNYTPLKVEAPSQSSDSYEEAVLYDKMGFIQVDIEQVDYMPINAKGNFEMTSEGFMKFVAPVARMGVYKYVLPDGTIRRDLVDEETLFETDAMKSLELKPFTNEHPDNLLDPETVKRHSVGSTGEKVYRDENHLMSSLVIMDAGAIQDVKNGKRQLSPGYRATLVVEPGTYNGENYDVKQRRRVYNHLALCTRARGGDSLALNLKDSVDGESFTNNNNLIPDKGVIMPKIRINGIDYDAAQEVINHVDSLTGRLTQIEQTAATNKDSFDKANKSLSETQAAFDAFKAGVPGMINQSVKERVRLEKLAASVLDATELVSLETLDNAAIKGKMIKAKFPTLDVTGKDEAYVSALIDSIALQPTTSAALKDQLDVLTQRQSSQRQAPVMDSAKSREQYVANLSDSWKKDPRTGK